MNARRIGIDFGGSKIEIAVIDENGCLILRRRVPTPKIYEDAIDTIVRLVHDVESETGAQATVGVGFPGRINSATGVVYSGNCLNGHTFYTDIRAAFGRDVRLANDANCFALSEAVDGAGRGCRVVFGAILGTGCGGGVTVNGQVIAGYMGIGGEWGHSLFPFLKGEENPARRCWCGQEGCIETVVSGRALARSYGGEHATDAMVVRQRADNGEARAQAALARHAEYLARALAQVVNLLDPDIIVLGGGLSNMTHLYPRLPEQMARYVFGGRCMTPVVRATHGDSSGVRGAAWLWPA